MTSNLTFKRTGKITLRCEPYLIMKFSTGYHALYGPQTARVTLGIYPTADEAKACCEAHSKTTGEKIPGQTSTNLPG